MKKIIHPQNPSFLKGYYLGIELTKDEVDISDIERIAKSRGFREQDYHHITVLHQSSFLSLFNKFSSFEQKKVLEKIEDLIQDIDWSFTPKNIYYVAGLVPASKTGTVDESREAYIRTIEMPGIDLFITKLNKILNGNITLRFPHITLFTKGENKNPKYYGIPINTIEEFKKLTTKKII